MDRSSVIPHVGEASSSFYSFLFLLSVSFTICPLHFPHHCEEGEARLSDYHLSQESDGGLEKNGDWTDQETRKTYIDEDDGRWSDGWWASYVCMYVISHRTVLYLNEKMETWIDIIESLE